MEGTNITYYAGIGRRKTAVARVRISQGNGKIEANGANLEKYFPSENLVRLAQRPLKTANCGTKYDIIAYLNGGGYSGQAGALSLGISRALLKVEPQLRPVLKKAGLLTRDSREKERKKYGQRGARRKFQFSKR